MGVWRGVLNIPYPAYLVTTPGEMLDMIACYQAIQWGADVKSAAENYIPDLR